MKFSIKRRKSYQKYWNSLKGKPSKTKGKTMIEIYGKEKTNKIKKKISNTLKNKYKNGLNSGFKKRNTYGIHIGKDNGMFGKHHTKKTLLIKKKKMKNWWRNKNNKDIIINRNKKISDKLKISKLGSKIKEETKKKMRIAAIKHKIKYGFTKPNIGKNEKFILDNLELSNSIKIIRQFPVSGYFVDGYCKEKNIVFEVDEAFHKKKVKRDIRRENNIKDELNCLFIRIKDV